MGTIIKYILLLFTVIFFFNCSFISEVPQFSSIEEAQTWVHENIRYVADIDQYGENDYFASPKRTLENRAGDCEDMAALLMYICHEQFYTNGSMVKVIRNGTQHSIAYISGKYYDPVYNDLPSFDKILHIWYYSEIIFLWK